ncbi:DivIVA domain-containing protein [Lactobacillus xylocopicola]|uniref:DivIVA domain-containing protein n=1 Tax=Lactobacillus xylocopicola TaxID=2976676 RepID=A0ABN6SJK8_9LACO|nr:DivIVA domain-containing protein [Lactobacillus xylocopicola]BDR60502.1 DivIVA domain-containing protein [Lactobacillus xylocopicola]
MTDIKNVKLTTDDILKKEFRTKVKGVDPEEVDTFLDQVIDDYDTFQQIIEDLYGQIGKLQRELMDDQHHDRSATEPQTPEEPQEHAERVKRYTPTKHSDSQDSTAAEAENSTNMAIIQRISTLERKVYNLEQRVYGLQKD